ncbi:hypothetical protein CTAYLR_001961 [Chrysophaeum taylorii]|uniref:Sugar phosphate transporter domain-containing protein n=1 Tax=Chrysophaeum taylorii TaxID=2483200 RepID=A0AAD7U8P4_9STRA|nr:hypothetical protein CTAYLR_001961 [Chrysophaeum taylorii]
MAASRLRTLRSLGSDDKARSNNGKQRRSPLGIASALFYCAVSIALVSCNKVVLTHHAFPSSLALAAMQFSVTCCSLGALALVGAIELPGPTSETMRVALPLTTLYLADVVLGLAATGALSLPMFTVLRRASIPMTMLLERAVGQSSPSRAVALSVWGMMVGATIAAYDDLAFDARSYGVVLANDALTAARGVYVKSALGAPRLSKFALLFYNAIVSLVVVAPFLWRGGHLGAIFLWLRSAEPANLVALLMSAGLGPVLQYAIFLCTQHNSALTTTVVGALKNILTAYAGMFLADYEFTAVNFAGITLSCLCSCAYSYVTVIRPATIPPTPLIPLSASGANLEQEFLAAATASAAESSRRPPAASGSA